jgi:hypothetical protein
LLRLTFNDIRAWSFLIESGLPLYLKVLWRFRGCGLPSSKLILSLVLVFHVWYILEIDMFH